jgi:hypothetical protein
LPSGILASAAVSGGRRRTAPWASCASKRGRWDDALAEVEILYEDLKEPAVACCDLRIAAVISFYRGEVRAAHGHLAVAGPHVKRIGHRLIGSFALARSLDCEHDGALPEALAALTDAFDGNSEDVDEIEDLIPMPSAHVPRPRHPARAHVPPILLAPIA